MSAEEAIKETLSNHAFRVPVIRGYNGLCQICGCGYAIAAYPWFPDWLDHIAPLVASSVGVREPPE